MPPVNYAPIEPIPAHEPSAKMRDLPAALGALNAEVDRLRAIAAELAKRLEPVMPPPAPRVTDAKLGDAQVGKSPNAPVVDAIAATTGRVATVRDMLDDLQSRLVL